jgi:hypothetical protein
MWQLENRTPFAAERAWVRDRNGAEVWLVAVKCTFDILADGLTAVSKAQPPVLRVPAYHGEEGKSSIKFDADLVLAKRTTDVVLVGHAHAPGGKVVTQMDVGFRVGPVQKVLRVFGDRCWEGFGVSLPQGFVRMPLVYERAFGGVDHRSPNPGRDWEWRNPVGTGFAISRENARGQRLPNLEYPEELISAWSDRPRPAGFGPIGNHWQPRAGFAGTYDDRWMQTRQPLLPEDFDERFFQCVPADQQAPVYLQGHEPVILRGVHPQGDLQFQLPSVSLGFDTRFTDSSREVHANCHLHTVILDADNARISLVWHSALPCHFKVQKLSHTIVRLGSGSSDSKYDVSSATDEAIT